MATSPTAPAHTAYSTTADDYTGGAYRPNQINQSINGRLSRLEQAAQSKAPVAAGGKAVAGINTGYFVATIAANAITPDLGQAFTIEVVLNQAAQVTINDPIFTGGTINPGQDLTIVVVQDATGARPAPAWGTNYAGVGSGTDIGPDPSTYSVFTFRVRADNKFALLYMTKGLAR